MDTPTDAPVSPQLLVGPPAPPPALASETPPAPAPEAPQPPAGDDITREASDGEATPTAPALDVVPAPTLRHVRMTRKAWAGFSGSFGGVRFLEGRSVEPVNQRQADKIAANTALVYDDGGSTCGKQHRLVGGATRPAAQLKPLARQSDAEKAAEVPGSTEARKVEMVLYSAADLEKIAEEKGIQGLRVIADPLKVKGRSITDVIAAILSEQAALAGRAALAGGRG